MSGRPCNVSDVLADLVEAVRPLAHKQQRVVKLSEVADPLQVAVEEPALRQALSNLIEGALLRTNVGGNVEIVSTGAPAGGTLVVIDDDGPDMHYMVKIVNSPPYQLVLNNQTRHCRVPSLCYTCIRLGRSILKCIYLMVTAKTSSLHEKFQLEKNPPVFTKEYSNNLSKNKRIQTQLVMF